MRAPLDVGRPADPLRAIYDDDVIRLFWDTKASYHVAEWHGFAKGERLRHAAHACIYAARERPSSRWLADIADFSVIGPDDQEWIVREFYPRLVESGVRFMAIVLPVRAVAQLSARSVNAAYGASGSLVFEYHATRAAAAHWLAATLA